VRYLFIQQHRGEYCLERWCAAMAVSVSGYYAWQQRPSSERERENQQLLAQIKAVHTDSDQTYGSPHIHAQLRAQGQRCSPNRVARLMHLNGITACRKRRFTPTTDSQHELPVAPNALNQQFEAPSISTKSG
jgi:putative transposase